MPEREDPEDKSFAKSRWTKVMKERHLLASYFCKGKKVLDTCCGSGWGTVHFIVPKSKSTLALDKYDYALKKFAKIKKFEFKVMDARNIQLGNTKYDIILALESIEHFTKLEAKKYFEGIIKYCKKESILIGTTPLLPRESLRDFFLKINKFHLQVYTKRRLENLLKKYFPFVKIYEVYNREWPYFFFICAYKNNKIKAIKKVEKYIVNNYKVFKYNKILNHFYLTKELIKMLRIKEAFSFFIHNQ